MYSKLKDVMRSKGYEVSEGGDWAASDTPHFVAFAKFVLGAQHVSPNQVMAHPDAFPVLMEALQGMTGEIDPPAPAAAPIDPPAAESAPIDPPVASDAPIDPPAEVAPESEEQPQDEQPAESTEQPEGEVPAGEGESGEGQPQE